MTKNSVKGKIDPELAKERIREVERRSEILTYLIIAIVLGLIQY